MFFFLCSSRSFFPAAAADTATAEGGGVRGKGVGGVRGEGGGGEGGSEVGRVEEPPTVWYTFSSSRFLRQAALGLRL